MNLIMIPISILLAGVLVLLGLLFGARYDISQPLQGGNVWRLDRLTGNLAICGGFDNKLRCKTVEE